MEGGEWGVRNFFRPKPGSYYYISMMYMRQKFLQKTTNFWKIEYNLFCRWWRQKILFRKDIISCAIPKRHKFLVASLKTLYMLIRKLTVGAILESSALTNRSQNKMLKKLLFILQLVCKRCKFCDFKIHFAVVTVSISVIIKNNKQYI